HGKARGRKSIANTQRGPSLIVHIGGEYRAAETALPFRAPAAWAISSPASLPYGGHADAGGLMSHGLDPQEIIDLAALAADKILRGGQSGGHLDAATCKTEFIINRRTVKALGLTIPPPLLLRADQVIE